MAAIDDLTAAVAAADAKIDAAAALIPQLQIAIADLKAQLASAPGDAAALTALANDLNTHVSALSAALNPPEPAPATP